MSNENEKKVIKVLKQNETPPYIPNNINSTTIQEYLYDTNQLLTRVVFLLEKLVNKDVSQPKVVGNKNINVLGRSVDREG